MKQHKLALSIALGIVVTFGLLVSLSVQAAPAQARPIQAPAAPTVDHSDAISNALAYLQTRQLPNGAIESDWAPGTADDFTTIKTVYAVAAARRPVSSFTSASGTTPLDYLAAQAFTYTHDVTGTLFPGRAGMLIAAAVAGNEDPYSFGGMTTTIDELTATYNAATGAYSTTAQGPFTSGEANTTNQLWAIIGLASAQERVPITATDFFISLQEADGGWAWVQGTGGDVDMTGLAVQALIASGNVEPTHVEVREGLDFLRDTQLDSGGWTGYFGALNADSTAAAIQAVAAAGYTPATASWATSDGQTPHDALLSLQQESDGSFGGNALATAHAVAGLAEAPLPILGREQRANRALTWMNEQQNADGSWPVFYGHPAGPACDAALAYAAKGFDPDTVMAAGSITSVMDYLSATASSYVTITSDSAGKLAVAVEAAGGDAYDFGGEDIVHVLTGKWYSPTLGAFGVPTNTWHQAWAILGLAAAGETVPVSATQTLTGLQQPSGGWKYDLNPAAWNVATADNTGLAMQALIAAGVPPASTSILSGTKFLRNQQDTQAGWGNANSTAYAIQGLLAAGENPLARGWLREGHSPYDALAAFQKADGPFVLGSTDDFFATRQAVPSLLGVHYPFTRALTPFVGVRRGPDPDRMVAAVPRASWGNSVDVIIPFGSDLDGSGDVTLGWRASGETTWVTDTTVHRADGYFTATLPLTELVAYEFEASFKDPQGVQYGSEMTSTVETSNSLEPYTLYLPLVLRQ